MHICKFSKPKKALSLAEIVWAVAILGVIIILVVGVFTNILVSSRKSEKLLVATNLAAKQRDFIKLMGFQEIPAGLTWDGKGGGAARMDPDGNGVFFPPCPPPPGPLSETIDGIVYYYKITTEYVSGTGNNLISILITVHWDETGNEGKNFITLEMFKTK